MSLDPQAAELIRLIEALPVPARGDMTVEEARQASRLYTEMLVPVCHVDAVSDEEIPGPAGAIPIRIYQPSEQPAGTLIYFHGGGWTLGDLDSSDRNCRALAREADCTIVSVGYRLAPEHKFPAAVEDAWVATKWVVENTIAHGASSDSVAVGGESSGANLAAAVALRARAEGIKLDLQLLIYPPMTFAFDTQSYSDYEEGFVLTKKAMAWYWDQYLADPRDGTDPLASPLQADTLENLAPALIITAEYDPLRDEAEEYGARLTRSGVRSEVVRTAGQIHGFFAFGGITSTAHRATLQKAATKLRVEFARAG